MTPGDGPTAAELPAIAGTAQALVPARIEIPTAAATKRPAAAGAILRRTTLPSRPGVPGSRPRTATPATVKPQTNKPHTSRPAASRIAACAVAPTPFPPPTPALMSAPFHSDSHAAGPGRAVAATESPMREPISCSQVRRASVVVDDSLASSDCQSVHLTVFDIGWSQNETTGVCQVGLRAA